MAKKKRGGRGKGGVNKSEAIRDYLTKNSDAGPKEIKEALKKRGVDVTDSLVSQVKYNSATSKKAKKRGRPKGQKATPASRRGRPPAMSNGVSFDALFEAKTLADRLGGVDRAKEAVSMLEKLI